jgi:hypothetical protein
MENEILEFHQKWLNGEDGGKRADMRHTNGQLADADDGKKPPVKAAGMKRLYSFPL